MIPVDPSADEARDWLAGELARAVYREARPNWFDTLVADFLEWLSDVVDSSSQNPSVLVLIVAVVVFAGLLIAAYFIFGPPRANRRSRAPGALFGDEDTRDAATIRLAAERAATARDWTTAIEEMFRAIARSLGERAVLSTSPGTTATGFASAATRFFPAQADDLAASAVAFDDVRYLDHPGSEAGYSRVAALERALRHGKPVFDLAATS